MNYVEINVDIFSDDIEDINKNAFERECHKYIYQPIVVPSKKRIIAIGDIHGDYNYALKCFKIAGLINDSLDWIGGDTYVVQVGDQLDGFRPTTRNESNKKCNHLTDANKNDIKEDIDVMLLFDTLDKKAREHGGAVISLLGNHELMNVNGNMDYVSCEGFKKFDNYKNPITNKPFPSNVEARKHAFKAGNTYAKHMACTRLPVIIIGSFLFSHAGIISNDVVNNMNIKGPIDLNKMGYIIRKWLLGMINEKYVTKMLGSTFYAMFWNRILGSIPHNINKDDDKCVNYLNPTLKLYKISHLIIGHTPQSFANGVGISGTCSDQLWRIDTGTSKAFSKFDSYYDDGRVSELRKAQVLEIINDNEINILS